MLAQVSLLVNAAATDVPEVVETTQAAPSWPLIAVLVIALLLAWRPRSEAKTSKRPE
ncbi:MAG: hypothetical protein AAGH41_04625 [Pseudomonadota bacterium]